MLVLDGILGIVSYKILILPLRKLKPRGQGASPSPPISTRQPRRGTRASYAHSQPSFHDATLSLVKYVHNRLALIVLITSAHSSPWKCITMCQDKKNNLIRYLDNLELRIQRSDPGHSSSAPDQLGRYLTPLRFSILQDKKWHTFSVKGRKSQYLGFPGNRVSAAITQLCCGSSNAATDQI